MRKIPFLANAFGQTLRKYREQNRMTQGDLALKIGSVSSYIRFLEHGQRIPTIATFHHLCSALNVDPHEFMSDYLQTMNRLSDTPD